MEEMKKINPLEIENNNNVSIASGFRKPTRAIFTQADLKKFINSEAYNLIISFVQHLNESVKGKPISDASYTSSERIDAILNMLKQIQEWVDMIPPVQQPMRFGNKAFRTWHEKLVKEAISIHLSLLPESLHPAAEELVQYLTESFGHPIRIDYGTGHETSFICWLLCLHKIGFLHEIDFPAIVLRVFVEYLNLMRKLQLVYMLEPAGSHGVWGLDDYQCLVFYFGSAQFLGHREVVPSNIIDNAILTTYSKDYLYLEAINFILQVKKGSPFAVTSPMLWDMTALPSWEKVNGGMLKLYRGEVLQKLPVIQHLVFGSLIPCTWISSQSDSFKISSHPSSEHPGTALHSPNFDLPGATAKAPWVDIDQLEVAHETTFDSKETLNDTQK